jgi:hypothetical protein
MGRRYGALNYFYDKIEAARQKDPVLNRTGDFQTLFNDADFMDAYYRHQMYYMDLIAIIETTYEKEIEKGCDKIPRYALFNGLTYGQIEVITGLDMDSIKNLQQTDPIFSED